MPNFSNPLDDSDVVLLLIGPLHHGQQQVTETGNLLIDLPHFEDNP